jgi:GH18 family chitinase
MEIKNWTTGHEYGRIGYYEAWNFNRSCLHMRARNADADGRYTILHWAFMSINPKDFTVVIVDEFKQWEGFKSLLGVKRVISFGGWAFSNDMPTYDILRQAVSPANRKTFAANVANFLKDHKLDGVDFDWEHPGVSVSLATILPL